MRSIALPFVALVLVGACYGPSGEATCAVICAGPGAPCPGAMVCNQYARCEMPGGATCGPNGEVIDAATIDSPRGDADPLADGPNNNLCIPMPGPNQQSIHAGLDFTPDRARARGAILVFSNTASKDVVAVAEGNFDSGSAPFFEVLTPVAANEMYSHPRMAPDGASIFLRTDSALGARFAEATRSGPNSWQTPQPLTLRNLSGLPLTVDTTMIPGIPSASGQRRMPVTTATGFSEFQADPLPDPTRTWREIVRYVPSDLNVSAVLTPNFTNDGLRVIFVGTTLADTNRNIYYASRNSLGVKFEPAHLLYDAGAGVTEATPYLTDDCSRLYFTNENAPIGEVIY